MKTGPFIIILTGESGSGKTTICTRVVTLARAQGLKVAGVLTPPRLVSGCKVGLDVEDVSTSHRHPLAEQVCATDGPTTESWHFHADGLAWGASVLCRATLCDLLVIDELGPLELVQDKGWTVGLDLLCDSRYRLTLVVVRPVLLPRLRERLGGVDLLVLPVTEVNRDDMSGEILTLLESQEVR